MRLRCPQPWTHIPIERRGRRSAFADRQRRARYRRGLLSLSGYLARCPARPTYGCGGSAERRWQFPTTATAPAPMANSRQIATPMIERLVTGPISPDRSKPRDDHRAQEGGERQPVRRRRHPGGSQRAALRLGEHGDHEGIGDGDDHGAEAARRRDWPVGNAREDVAHHPQRITRRRVRPGSRSQRNSPRPGAPGSRGSARSARRP